jgi:hypothetical protein
MPQLKKMAAPLHGDAATESTREGGRGIISQSRSMDVPLDAQANVISKTPSIKSNANSQQPQEAWELELDFSK